MYICIGNNKNLLEKVQKCTTKLIPELQKVNYENWLKELVLEILESSRDMCNFIEILKVTHAFELTDHNVFFTKQKAQWPKRS